MRVIIVELERFRAATLAEDVDADDDDDDEEVGMLVVADKLASNIRTHLGHVSLL